MQLVQILTAAALTQNREPQRQRGLSCDGCGCMRTLWSLACHVQDVKKLWRQHESEKRAASMATSSRHHPRRSSERHTRDYHERRSQSPRRRRHAEERGRQDYPSDSSRRQANAALRAKLLADREALAAEKEALILQERAATAAAREKAFRKEFLPLGEASSSSDDSDAPAKVDCLRAASAWSRALGPWLMCVLRACV